MSPEELRAGVEDTIRLLDQQIAHLVRQHDADPDPYKYPIEALQYPDGTYVMAGLYSALAGLYAALVDLSR